MIYTNEQVVSDTAIAVPSFDWKQHRLYAEYTSLRTTNPIFANQYGDNIDDFDDWVFDYEIDSDWQ